ncbi:hypothetical protein HDU92_005953 [Lobulomyces angularis]|nr:hypothetical protein HDU92_005953 [Lobulomyces angularis]
MFPSKPPPKSLTKLEVFFIKVLRIILSLPISATRCFVYILEMFSFGFLCNGVYKKIKIIKNEEPVEGAFIFQKGYVFDINTFDKKNSAVILHVHGGAFIFGSCFNLWESQVRILKNLRKNLGKDLEDKINLTCLTLDYPLSPENSYPSALKMVSNAYLFLIDMGFENIFLSGDSAGGNLILSFLFHWKNYPDVVFNDGDKSTLISPLAATLISPWVDLSNEYNEIPFDSLHPSQKVIGNPVYLSAVHDDGPQTILDARVNPLNGARGFIFNDTAPECELHLPLYGFCFVSGDNELFNSQIEEFKSLMKKNLKINNTTKIVLEKRGKKIFTRKTKQEELKEIKNRNQNHFEIYEIIGTHMIHDFCLNPVFEKEYQESLKRIANFYSKTLYVKNFCDDHHFQDSEWKYIQHYNFVHDTDILIN